jgi:hypothetical protein
MTTTIEPGTSISDRPQIVHHPLAGPGSVAGPLERGGTRYTVEVTSRLGPATPPWPPRWSSPRSHR